MCGVARRRWEVARTVLTRAGRPPSTVGSGKEDRFDDLTGGRRRLRLVDLRQRERPDQPVERKTPLTPQVDEARDHDLRVRPTLEDAGDPLSDEGQRVEDEITGL